MSFQPRIFTFYSYKGGVGRSMALLNTAYYLQARGRHVLIVDLDLDAPGASGFLHRTKELLPHPSTGDVVDVLSAVVQTVKSAPPDCDEPPLPALRLEAFLRSVAPGHYAPAVNPRAPRARLDVLAADQTRDYTARLSALELPALTAKQIAQASDLLRGLLLQHTFPFQQPWQEEGAPPENTRYDYILVDSRTGLSEIGGLCVGPLSDRLVVLCGLNDQNINGTRHFLEIVGLEPKARPANAKGWDDDDPPAGEGLRPATLGPKPTLLVASPVPGGEMTYKKERLGELEKQIGLQPLKLSYHPQMALMETLFVRDYADEYLALEYATMANRVMSMVSDTEHQFMSTLHRFFGGNREEDKFKAETLALPRHLARATLTMGRSRLMPFGSFIDDKQIPSEIQDQLRRVQINLAVTNQSAAEGWLEWADALDTPEARKNGDPKVFLEMEDKYRKALASKPDFPQALHNWGSALANWAEAKQGAEADTLFAQACEKYQQALVIDSDYIPALNGWGDALGDWAKIKQDAEADALFTQACDKYQQALTIEPKFSRAFRNWGVTLAHWAGRKEKAEADQLFDQAEEKFLRALELQPDNTSLHFNLGCLAALRGDVDKSIEYLERWKTAKPEAKRSELDDDKDFDLIRGDPRFLAFRDTLAA